MVNVAGANTLAGTVDLEGNTTIRSDAGSLTLSPSATVTGPGYTLTLDGAGNGAINSALNLGAVAGDALVKNGSGAWVVTGSGGYTGTTSVNGGLLRIASGAAVLDGGSALNLGGGRITNSGPAVQTANGLNLLAGGGNVTGISMLSVGSITRLPGATAAFSGNVRALGAFNDPTGILGSYAMVGSDWARVNGSSQIVAFNAYHDDVSTAAITDNARDSHYQSLTVATTANSLKLSGGSGLNIGASDLNLVAGGLLHSSSLLSGISGTGFITAGNGISDELVITTTGGTLDIATPLVGNFSTGGLTMTGNGKLVLSGSSNFSGPVNINGGTLSIVGPGGTTHPTELGTSSGPRNLNINGGTFEVVGGDYDSGSTNMYYVIGSSGATIRSVLGSIITINDGGDARHPQRVLAAVRRAAIYLGPDEQRTRPDGGQPDGGRLRRICHNRGIPGAHLIIFRTLTRIFLKNSGFSGSIPS